MVDYTYQDEKAAHITGGKPRDIWLAEQRESWNRKQGSFYAAMATLLDLSRERVYQLYWRGVAKRELNKKEESNV